jgi:glycosyltransferase involved in cell wall biosynthesis
MQRNFPSSSVIITLYKDLKSLKVVLEALERQTYKTFEIVIAEDDDADETVEFLKAYDHLNIVHVSQADTGRNKVIIQNKAIVKASGEYLFFLDGDIVPFKHFIEYSLDIAQKKQVLAGRRVNLPQELSELIKQGEFSPNKIEENYLSFLLKHRKNREVRADQGIELNPNGFLFKLLSKRKRNAEILGCNFSCFKEDMVAINGFDEGYGNSVIGQEDTDLTWRFLGLGIQMKSAKNIANCFHLWHKENSNRDAVQDKIDLALMKEKQEKKLYFCEEGLTTVG